MITDRVTDRSLSTAPISHDGLTTGFLLSCGSCKFCLKKRRKSRKVRVEKFKANSKCASRLKIQGNDSAGSFPLHFTFAQRVQHGLTQAITGCPHSKKSKLKMPLTVTGFQDKVNVRATDKDGACGSASKWENSSNLQ